MAHVSVSARSCTGCHMCEYACSGWHEGTYAPDRASLRIEVNPTTGAIRRFTCRQTACARCEEVCPEEAIVRHTLPIHSPNVELTEAVVLRIDPKKCTSCGACYEVCPYGVIKEHPVTGKAYKCDLCDGDPQCLAFCQNPMVRAVTVKGEKGNPIALTY